MKTYMKVICATMVAFACMRAHTQTEKTRVLIGGNISGWAQIYKSNLTTIGVNAAPVAGYFIKNGLFIGGRMNLGYTYQWSQQTVDFTMGPEIRYYAGKGEKIKVVPMLHVMGGTHTYIYSNTRTTTPVLTEMLGVALAIFPHRGMDIEIGLGVTAQQYFKEQNYIFIPQLTVGINGLLDTRKK